MLTTRPNNTYDAVLSTADDTDPPIKVKYLPYGDYIDVCQTADQMETAATGTDRIKLARQIIDQCVAPDQQEELDRLAMPEIFELMRLCLGQNFGADDKKKSE